MKFFQWIINLFSSLFSKKKETPKVENPIPTQPNPPVVDPPPLDPIEEEIQAPESQPEFPLPDFSQMKIVTEGKDHMITCGDLKVKFIGSRNNGLYTIGAQLLITFIDTYPSKLSDLNISESAMNMIKSVSDNEGNFDAINTYDNSFLSIGLFQWSMGAKNRNGELAAVLKKIKQNQPELFKHYFGQFELDVAPDTSSTYGYLVFKGNKVDAVAEKEVFRTPGMAFRFWAAAQHPDIQAIQVEHALSRLKTFYWKANKVKGKALAELITSEYGVALILDNHVNRPGYVYGCVKAAWEEAGLGDPNDWTSAEERALIEAYLKIRVDFGRQPMTHAEKRARNTKRYLNQGTISDERGSFKYENFRSRSMSKGTIPAIPSGYNDTDYEEIRNYDDSSDSEE